MLDVGRHPNIKLMAYSELEKLEGSAGRFTATVRRKARYVDEEKCTGCGACTEKCPTVVDDAFNLGHGKRKAVYSWFAQGIPSTHTIDPDHCRVLNGKKCGICQKKCQAQAIDFEQKDRLQELEVGAVIAATGYEIFDPSNIPEYRYTQLDNVVTAIEFERFLSASGPTAGHLDRPSDTRLRTEIARQEKAAAKVEKALGRFEKKFSQSSVDFYADYQSNQCPQDDKDRKAWAAKYEDYQKTAKPLAEMKKKAEQFKTAKKLAFIQCVGSRDFRFYPFCSGFCCMHSIKEAIIAHEHDSETTSVIFGMDIRAVGKGFEEYKVRGSNNSKITYTRGRVAEIAAGPGDMPMVVYEDTVAQRVRKEAFDLVILATACAPAKGIDKLRKILAIEIDEFGFFKTDSKNPLDSTRKGVFVCGCAHSPMDIPESVAQASSAASRAVQTITRAELKKAS